MLFPPAPDGPPGRSNARRHSGGRPYPYTAKWGLPLRAGLVSAARGPGPSRESSGGSQPARTAPERFGSRSLLADPGSFLRPFRGKCAVFQRSRWKNCGDEDGGLGAPARRWGPRAEEGLAPAATSRARGARGPGQRPGRASFIGAPPSTGPPRPHPGP
jgi:hypothetical protein